MSDSRRARSPTGEHAEVVGAIHGSRRRPGEAIVSFESGARLRLPVDHNMTLGLRPGQVIETDRLAELLELSDYETGRSYALRALAARALGSVELKRRLRRRGHAAGVAERIVERVVEAGLIDDEAYAAAAARSMVIGKPAGARLVEQKLAAKGVERGLARRLAEEVAPQEGALELAIRFASRRVVTIRASARDEAAVRRRLAGALARRGFDPDVCRKAVDSALSGAG